MKQIHKYVLTKSVNRVPSYEGAKVIHIGNQREQITVWAEVHTLERESLLELRIVGTGGEVPIGGRRVGSALMANGEFVFHVYEVTS